MLLSRIENPVSLNNQNTNAVNAIELLKKVKRTQPTVNVNRYSYQFKYKKSKNGKIATLCLIEKPLVIMSLKRYLSF